MDKKHFVAIITVAIMLVVAQFTFAQAEHQPSDVIALAWNRAGTKLAIGQWDGTVRISNYLDNTSVDVLTPSAFGTSALAWSLDESHIASLGWYKLIVANLVTQQKLEVDIATDYAIVWLPNGIAIGTSGADTTELLRIIDPITGRIILSKEDVRAISAFALSPSHSQLAIADITGGVSIWNTELSQNISTTASVQQGDLQNAFGWTIAWSPDGTKLITGHQSGIVKVWDVANLQEGSIIPLVWEQNAQLSEMLGYDTSLIRAVAFSTDGNEVFTIAADGTLRTWNAQTGQLRRDIQLGESIYAAAFSPDGSQLAIGGSVTQMTILPAHMYDPSVTSTPTPTLTPSQPAHLTPQPSECGWCGHFVISFAREGR